MDDSTTPGATHPPCIDNETRIILWLQQSVSLPVAQIVSLWRRFGCFDKALQASRQQLAEVLSTECLQHLLRCRDRWDGSYQREQPDGVTLLPLSSPDYPVLLRELHCPPPLLYVRGDVQLLSMPQIGIVGSRKHTTSGGETARAFARELSGCGFAITSGLALGIDGMAHMGALQGGGPSGGKTLAVMASGVSAIYPRRHHKLAQQILDNGGALISEMPVDTTPLPAYFPQRNRIISGLALGVLVVEAAHKSGSLITARFAMEQGREVFAVPGSIHNPVARGCHQLIREGATLVETVDDIAGQLGAMVALKRDELDGGSQQVSGIPPVDRREQQLLEVLGYDPVDFDILLERSGLPVPELSALLLGLELKGAVEQNAGRYQRIS